MKRSEVEIGGRYAAKVSGYLTTVRIMRDLGMDLRPTPGCTGTGLHKYREVHDGWDAINVAAGRAIHLIWRNSDPREAQFRGLAALLRRHAPQGVVAPSEAI